MKEITIVLCVLATFGLAFWMSNPVITFKPFHISLPCWYKGAAWLLMIAMWVCVSIGLNSEYKRGTRDGIERTIDFLSEQLNNNNNGTEQHQ